jgi:hypothetical protein
MSANSPDVPENFRDGRYVVTTVLGEGSQGETLEAVDKLRGCPVAVKRFRIKGARSWKDVELAEREARVLASLDHPNLPRYVEHFEEGGCLFLVTERIEGTSLSALKASHVSFSESDVLRLLDDARSALGYLHRRAPPVIHRDIKPGNVIRRPDGSYAFVDFGAVRDSLKPEGGSTVVGTFGFMAPEQFQGRALPASDVYSVGATALSMLTGRDPEQLPHVGLGIDVRRALGPTANPELVAALTAMLEPDPDRRVSGVPSLREACWERPSQVAQSSRAVWPVDTPAAWQWPAASWGPGYGQWHGAGRRAWPRARGARPPWSPHGAYVRRPGLPFPFLLAAVVVLALLAMRMATFGILRVALPVLLMVLGMRRAASAVIRAGEDADGLLQDASRRVRGVSHRDAPAGIDTPGRTAAASHHAPTQVRVGSERPGARSRTRVGADEASPDEPGAAANAASQRTPRG